MDIDTFLERYPVFSGVSPDIIETILSEQTFKVPVSQWTNTLLRSKAIGLLTAHILRLQYGDQLRLGGALRSLEEGKEVKIDLIDLTLPYYQQTIYGQEYLNLRSSVLTISMFVV